MGNRDNALNIWDLFDIPTIEAGGVEAYLQTILTRCAGWFGASIASVFVRDVDGVIRCRGSIGTAISPDASIVEGKGIAGSALLHGHAMLVDDPSANPILADKIHSKRSDIGSAMVIPLVSNSRKLGVLNLARNASEGAFTEADLAKANTLASNISLAVANWQMIGEIKSASDRMTTVFNLLNVAILTIRDHEVLQHNDEAERLLGIGDYQSMLMNLPRAFADAINIAVAEAEEGYSTKVQRQVSDQTWTVSASPLPEGGALLVVEDITSTVNATQELARVRRLAEIGQMTAAIAHEIRNPLTGIRSAAQLMSMAPEQSEELGKMIEDEAMKLNELCNQFLEFAKPVEPDLAPGSLETIAARLAAVHAQEFANAGVELTIIDHGHRNLTFDKNQIEQVMRNLAINALHASSIGGRVTIDVNANGFSVSDTGTGMDEATVKQLFMPFFTTKPKGTGLGLSKRPNIGEPQSGEIEVESKLGQGSRFTVRFADHLKVAA